MSAASDEKETGRVEAFSDGVFAIAITLLVLELKVPHDLAPGTTLLGALAAQWPSYAAFLTSFATIGIMWINHHRLFMHIRRVDNGLLLFNLFLLLGVTVVPFPTAVFAQHSHDRAAAILYSGSFVAIAFQFNLLWWHARRGNRLLPKEVDEDSARYIDWSYRLGPILYFGCVGLAFASVHACIAANFALAVFFALPSRRKLLRD